MTPVCRGLIISRPFGRFLKQKHLLTCLLVFGSLTLLVFEARPQQICVESRGGVAREVYYSTTLDTSMYYSVYTPPCYTANSEPLPVLYLMHGSNDDDNHWLRLGLAETLDNLVVNGDIPPAIVALPFGNWIANENVFGDVSWATVFVEDLMPEIEMRYRVSGDKDARMIGGISRGGFWAFHIAFKRPDLFSAVGGHSAFFDRFHAAPEHNPLDLASQAAEIEDLRIYLDRGAEDYAAPGLEIMNERLIARGVDFEYTVFPTGSHNNSYWSEHLPEYLAFYFDEMALDDAPVPIETEQPTVESSDDISDAGILPTEIAGGAVFASDSNSRSDGEAYFLLAPAVAFPSLAASIDTDRLQAIRAGLADPDLALGESAARSLRDNGIQIDLGVRIVPDDELVNLLWRDRRLFTLVGFDQLTPRLRMLRVNEVLPIDISREEYPFAFESDTPNYDPAALSRVLYSGVTALTRATQRALDENGVDFAASGIKPYIETVDFFHVSNEVSVTADCPEADGPLFGGSLSFCTKPDHFELLIDLGVDIVELTGNHNNDYGYAAYYETLDLYRANGIITVGGGETLDQARRPVIIEHNNNRIALVACNWVGPYYALVNENPAHAGGVRPGAAPCDRVWLADTLAALELTADIIIVSTQYQEFDQYQPSARQQQDFRFLTEAGADVVVGTQAHFPQTFEFSPRNAEPEAFIHYGLGNLYFDQTFFAGRRFFMDQFMIYQGRLLGVDLFTGIIDDQVRPRPMSPEERENFLFLIMIQNGGF